MRLPYACLFVLYFSLPLWSTAQGTQPDGVLDGLDELTTRHEVMFPMSDSVVLATDVILPILNDDLGIANLEINLGDALGVPLLPSVTVPKLKLANRGLQFYQYPNQENPYQLPGIFTRTPYSKADPTQAQAETALGYVGMMQDMRGRDASAGVYLPMFSDSWAKAPYLDTIHHPLDTTAGHLASFHQDGHESLQLIYTHLRRTENGDSVFISDDPQYPLVFNGDLGMLGGSATANTQYQAAAVAPTNTDSAGLKCLLPMVSSGEFYHCTGHHNGVFRERIIDGWLRGQVESYNNYSSAPDSSVFNFIHSMQDYGPQISTPKEAAETAIDFWTTMNAAHEPNSFVRAVMDISHAPLDENGNPDPNGSVSRYTNLDLPIYNLTGWWDIFIDGQIQTHQLLQQHTTKNKHRQKLVIGPFAHQTISSRATGDMREDPTTGADNRYPENVTTLVGVNINGIDLDNLGNLSDSEVIDYFRHYLGQPTVVLPTVDEWQYLAEIAGTDVFIKVPADTFNVSFANFFNFFMGTGPLNQLPISIKGLEGFGVDSTEINYIDLPATGTSLLGEDLGGITLADSSQYEWDATQTGGIPEVRFYVVGPVNDGISGEEAPRMGNYWYAADTFPLPDLPEQTLYFQGNGDLSINEPASGEVMLDFLADPDNPVVTHGGANMIVKTPDGTRDSQGQMNLADPAVKNLTMTRPEVFVEGEYYTDVLAFESGEIQDSFSIAGFPVAKLFMKSRPLDNKALDSTNTDFVVRIVDVYPDGRELYVQEGAVNARARDYAAHWAETGTENDAIPFTNIAADSLYEYKFRMLPIAYTFGKGHKIKVLISSTNYPRYQPCPNVPLEPGSFLRRRPYEARSIEFRGETLYPRKAVNTMAISDIYAGGITFQVLGGNMLNVNREEAFSPTNKANELAMYPNPARERVQLTMETPGNYRLEVRNPMGQRVLSGQFSQQYSLRIGELPAGVYLVKVSNPATGEAFSRKLVKH